MGFLLAVMTQLNSLIRGSVIRGESTPAPPPAAPAGPGLAMADELRQVIANVRRSAGRPSFVRSLSLDAAAGLLAEDLASRGVVSHTMGNGWTLADRLSVSGYQWANVAEDAAMSWGASPAIPVHDWLASPPHRANLLGDYRELGVGVATDRKGRCFWVATFGTPRGG